MSRPKVSVITTVFNGEDHLEEAIESVLSQSFEDFEYIIVDDCSTDTSASKLTDMASKDDRIRVIQNEKNIGTYASANFALESAKGEYIARLDHDDVSLPDRLAKQVKILDENPEVGLTASQALRIDGSGDKTGTLSYTPTKPHELATTLFFANPIIHSSIMFRTDVARKFGGYNASYPSTQDYDFYFRMIASGSSLHASHEKLIKYRSHDDNMTSVSSDKQKGLIYTVLKTWYKELLDMDITDSDVELLVWPPKDPAPEQTTKLSQLLKQVISGYEKRFPEDEPGQKELVKQEKRLASGKPLGLGYRLSRKARESTRSLGGGRW